MLQRAAVLRLRAVAAVFAWLPLVLDATQSNDLTFSVPAVGLLSGVLPVRWFPWLAPAQALAAAGTLSALRRRDLSRGWLVPVVFALFLLLNLALWLRARAPRAPPRVAEATPRDSREARALRE